MKNTLRLSLLAVLAQTSFSQSVLYTLDGDSTGDWFGRSVSGAGDVNGDGFDDVIVGAIKDDNNGTDSGSARVFSGLDGSVLYTFNGASKDDAFGFSVSGAGDVNGDGFDDLIVGAPFYKLAFRGRARVFSGLDGSVLITLLGDAAGDAFGYSVSGAGDVNGDGFDDLIVGAPFGKLGDRGSARVSSGLDGSELYTFVGDSPDDRFGWSVSGAGDVNGDGFDDLIVGAPLNQATNRGRARVLSGLDGSTLYVFGGSFADDRFGYSVSGAGDVNGDGFADLIVGAYRNDLNGTDSGMARVFSGLDGSTLHIFLGDSELDHFGWSVSGAGDVNRDGFADLIVGAGGNDKNGEGAGLARVFSGLGGSVYYTFHGDSAGDFFGSSVSCAGDVDGDGFDDLIVGASGDDNNGRASGSARVFSGCDDLGTSYCTPAIPNSSGQPAVISACGSDLPDISLDGGYFMLHASDLPPGQFGYFLVSETQAFVAAPGGSQGNLCLGGDIGRFTKKIKNSGPGGKFAMRVNLGKIPTNPPQFVLFDETWNFQAWYRDVNPGPTSNFTDAVSVLFQ